MPIQQDRQGRPQNVTETRVQSVPNLTDTARELFNKRIPGIPPGSIDDRLLQLVTLLQRQFKPPTIQYIWQFVGRFASLPALGGNAGQLILDHDDDRTGIFLFNNGAAGANFAVLRHDDGNMPTSSDGFLILPQTYFTFPPGFAPSNRIFACSSGSPDLYVSVLRVDRFPRSTR